MPSDQRQSNQNAFAYQQQLWCLLTMLRGHLYNRQFSFASHKSLRKRNVS